MLTLVNKALLVKLFYLSGESATEALRKFRTQRNVRQRQGPITVSGLKRLVQRFEETGSLADRPRSGRPRLAEARAGGIASQMDALAAESTSGVPVCSGREVARNTGIPKTSVFRVVHGVLHLYPYKLQSLHELKPDDVEKRTAFAQWALEKIEADPQWLFNILWTDEAHFSLHGTVNTHNCRIWAKDNPHAYTEEPLHAPRLTVWCGFSASVVIGPFFFEEPCATRGWKTCTVTGQRYLKMLQDYVVPCLRAQNLLNTITFMQDGAPPHVTSPVKQFLINTFGQDRLISRLCTYAWPPRSPDLTPADFWLWGYLKSRVYAGSPSSLAQLKDAIRREVTAIDPDMLHASVSGVVTRLHNILGCGGGHIEQLLV